MSKSNESAFPTHPFTGPDGTFNWGENGMNKREFMAMTVLAGLAANPNVQPNKVGMTNRAVELTDLLLEVLEK